jgi:hypothetical protein
MPDKSQNNTDYDVMQQKTIYTFFLILLLFTLERCANPVTPTGGPKDTQPPKTVKCTPPNLSTHFSADEIKIEFDEFIQLKDPDNQIIISPPWLPNIDFKVRGKSIIVKLNDSLRANTTYAFNFGDAISDITENNILSNFMYVFSSGSYIDSLSLDGQIIDAVNLTPQKDVLAMLYLDIYDTIPFDSLPYKVKPYYLTRTDEKGEFTLKNLSGESFKLFALKDINGSFTYDLPDEKIGFHDSLVKGVYKFPVSTDTIKTDTIERDTIEKDTITKSTLTKDSVIVGAEEKSLISIRLFQQYDSIQRIMRSDVIQDGQVGLYFRYPTEQPEFIPLNFTPSADWKIEEISRNHDTVFLWVNKLPYDSLVLQVCDNGKIIDTVEFDMSRKAEKPKGGKKDVPLSRKLMIKSNCMGGAFKQFTTDLSLSFSYPLSDYHFSSVSLVDGKDTVKPKIVFADSLGRSVFLFHKWKEESKYKVIIPDSTFYAINDITNDSLILDFKTRSAREYGSLKLSIKIKESEANYIIQLLNEKDVLLDERRLTGSENIEFNYLDPRNYRIKAINDHNKNGRWDTGDYLNKIQPEKVIIFPRMIEIRANWEVEETWEL